MTLPINAIAIKTTPVRTLAIYRHRHAVAQLVI